MIKNYIAILLFSRHRCLSFHFSHEFFTFECCHAASSGGSYSLAKYIILHITCCKNTRNISGCTVCLCNQVTLFIHIQLVDEYTGIRLVSDSNKNTFKTVLCNIISFNISDPYTSYLRHRPLVFAYNLLQNRVPDNFYLRIL